MEPCPICLNELNDENSATTNCNHTLCLQCIEDLLDRKNNSCPLCRGIIKEFYNREERTRVIFKTIITNTNNGNVNNGNVNNGNNNNGNVNNGNVNNGNVNNVEQIRIQLVTTSRSLMRYRNGYYLLWILLLYQIYLIISERFKSNELDLLLYHCNRNNTILNNEYYTCMDRLNEDQELGSIYIYDDSSNALTWCSFPLSYIRSCLSHFGMG